MPAVIDPSALAHARDTIRELIAEGRNGWLISYLVERAECDKRTALQAVADAAADGEIEIRHSILCPETAASLTAYRSEDEIPADGKLIECYECLEFHEIERDFTLMFEQRYAIPGSPFHPHHARTVG